MTLEFLNGAVIDVTEISETKQIYSVPKKWELEIISTQKLTSEELDVLLAEENTAELVYTDSDGQRSTFCGYNEVIRAAKKYNDAGVTLTLVLRKEV